MKKLIFMIVIILTFIVIKVYPACDPGWDPEDYTYEYAPGCSVTVYYCSIILPTGEYEVQVDAIRVDIPCGLNYLDDPNFWGDLENRLINDIEQNGSFPPCPLTAFNVKIWRAKCWKIQNDPNHDQVVAINCGYLAYCEKKYTICYDSKQGKNIITLIETNSIGTPDCPDEIPLLPPLFKTWDDEWKTDCYGVSCI